MCREDMEKRIIDMVVEADDWTLEQLFWLVVMETSG